MLLLASALVLVSLGQLIVAAHGRDRPLGRPADRARRRRLLVLRGRGPERRTARRSACSPCIGVAVAVGLTNARARPRVPARARARDARDVHRDPGRLAARCARSPAGFCRLGRHLGDARRAGAGSRSRSSSRASLAVVGELVLRAHALRARAARRRLRRDARAPARRAGQLDARRRVRPLLAVRGGRRDHARLAGRRRRRDASASNYTLTSITAVVLGGASIFGGRGSFIGALLGARADPGDHHLDRRSCRSTHLVRHVTCRAVLAARLLILVRRRVYSRARGVLVHRR